MRPDNNVIDIITYKMYKMRENQCKKKKWKNAFDNLYYIGMICFKTKKA